MDSLLSIEGSLDFIFSPGITDGTLRPTVRLGMRVIH